MHVIQNIIFPEQGICTEPELYCRLDGIGGISASKREIYLNTGATALFDTYFNVLSIGKWHAHCDLRTLGLVLAGRGRVELRVYHAIPDRSWEMLVREVLTLSATAQKIDLSHYRDVATRGVIFFEITALSKTVFTGAGFTTDDSPETWPRLAVSITTFRREAEVQKTTARLENFLRGFAQGENLHIQVVDNGQSADIPASDKVSYLPNRNLGGAGGFARGLREAKSAGFSHCLFMDDDASFHMENIHRTYMFLALAKDSRTALAGAMINNSHKWAMWENGAVFDQSCRPQFGGLDLRQRINVLELEFTSARESRANFYGGWWFFAFPLAHVDHHPFPFFVRGDDISFSLANEFTIATLNGVVSFQDDFTEKESPQTLYLDLRNHLLHHLIFEDLERGAAGCARVALRFILRSLARFHYETAEAQLLSWQDVMRGPEFFTEHIDMAERRQSIKSLTKNETWQPVETLDLSVRRRFSQRGRIWHRLFLYSLNGHFLPFFKHWGDHIVLPISERGHLHPCWGAARITYLNSARDMGYSVRPAKFRFFGFGWRLARTAWRFIRDYDRLQAAYRQKYPEMTSETYWEDIFAPQTAPKPLAVGASG